MPPLQPIPSEFLTIHFTPTLDGSGVFRINGHDADRKDFVFECPLAFCLQKYNITDEQYLAIRAMLAA